MRRNRVAVAASILITLVAAGWIHFLRAAPGTTLGMAIIEDVKGDRIAVEPTDNDVWNRLVELYHSKERMWIGGVVEVLLFIKPDPHYPWGFHFKPGTITVAEVTAEGCQTTIRDLSKDIDYWIAFGQAYVFATVVEIHSRGLQ